MVQSFQILFHCDGHVLVFVFGDTIGVAGAEYDSEFHQLEYLGVFFVIDCEDKESLK